MDDAQIRREYFRRFNLMLAAIVLIAAIAFLPATFLNPVHKKPIVSWLILTVGFTVMALGVAHYHRFVKRAKTLFSWLEKEKSTHMHIYALRFFLIYLFTNIVPDVLAGDFDLRTELICGSVFFASVLPPAIWFLKWRERLIASLPPDNSLIEPPTRLPA